MVHAFQRYTGFLPDHKACPKFKRIAEARRPAHAEIVARAHAASVSLRDDPGVKDLKRNTGQNGPKPRRVLYLLINAIAESQTSVAAAYLAMFLAPNLPSREYQSAPDSASQRESNIGSAHRSVQQGQLGRANRQLSQLPRHLVTEASLGSVQAAFPKGIFPPVCTIAELECLPSRITAKEVRDLVQSKPKTSAPGPSRNGYEFFKRLCKDSKYGAA